MYSKETIIEILLFQLCYFRLRNIPDSEKVFIRYNSLDIKTNKTFCAPNFCLQPLVINSRHWHILGKCVTTELHPQWESLSIHLVRVLLLLVFCFFLLSFPFYILYWYMISLSCIGYIWTSSVIYTGTALVKAYHLDSILGWVKA